MLDMGFLTPVTRPCCEIVTASARMEQPDALREGHSVEVVVVAYSGTAQRRASGACTLITEFPVSSWLRPRVEVECGKQLGRVGAYGRPLPLAVARFSTSS